MAERRNRDDPQVVVLLEQLQAQFYTIGKVSSFVGALNTSQLRADLYEMGWNSRLKDDGMTVELYEREQTHGE